ncbi:MAG: anthranilate/aminodeoxychorismate synthase component II, partial [Bacteroidetes bacterium]|nr:anthranilate/aminodeoxychorismate synthase component II [Bacteroidota bacterium]
LPSVLEVSARSEDGTIMGLRHVNGLVEGIQFHPESLLTEEGPKMVANWMDRVEAFGTETAVR